MTTAGSSLLTTMLGLAGILFGLAMLVQIIQEAWKYLWSTKSSAYERALFQFIGPWARQLSKTGLLADLEVNGPFQFWRRRPGGKLMPLEKPELVDALERTAPAWVRRTLEVLRIEVAAATAVAEPPPPTPALTTLLAELASAERGSPGYATAKDVIAFLRDWKVDTPTTVDADARMIPLPPLTNATAMLAAFRERFLPHVTKAERTFEQLTANFDYIYRRRNTLLTVGIALMVTLLIDRPIGRLYKDAAEMSPEQAGALVESLTQIYDSLPPPGAALGDTATRAKVERIRTRAIEVLNTQVGLGIDSTLGSASDESWFNGIGDRFIVIGRRISDRGAMYLLECLVTTLLISFGAPFWNDLAGTLLRMQRGPPRQGKSEDKT